MLGATVSTKVSWRHFSAGKALEAAAQGSLTTEARTTKHKVYILALSSISSASAAPGVNARDSRCHLLFSPCQAVFSPQCRGRPAPREYGSAAQSSHAPGRKRLSARADPSSLWQFQTALRIVESRASPRPLSLSLPSRKTQASRPPVQLRGSASAALGM